MIDQARETMNRVRGEMRRLRVLNAIARRGIDPDDGSQTVPALSQLGLPADAITDPISSQPISHSIYQREVPDSPL